MHKVKNTEPGSIAHQMELAQGDILLAINGQKIADVLDYRFMIQEEKLVLEIEKPNGDIWELEIEKDETDDLGLIFESGLMDKPHTCDNKCIFCFMDQLPKGMRSSLYFKDDDPRLSFLSGNYVTLTNLSGEEARRIARYHLSPLHISVHTSNPDLRCKMLNNPAAGKLFEYLTLFSKAGISMHFQIVLCKGINDGAAFDDTIGALLSFGLKAASLSVVPVGLTKYRDGLYPLSPFSQKDAQAVIKQVEKWQAYARKKHGTSFVFCADEWYIKAGLPMPPYKHYEDFPQLENGVGMWALFKQAPPKKLQKEDIGIVTGEAAQSLIKGLYKQAKIYTVKNNFFGRAITVSGLLTGRDIIAQIGERARQDGCKSLFLPENMFRAGTEYTLDDITKDEIENELGLPVRIGEES